MAAYGATIGGAFAIGPPGNDVAVRERNLDGGIAGNHTQPMVSEAQVGNDFRAQHAGDIRSGGNAATGSDFFGDTTTADDFATLKNQRGESGARQIGGGRQTIVASTDHHSIIGC